MKMWTCKQVSNALARKHFDEMTKAERIGLRMHIFLCFVCGKFNRQVLEMQEMTRRFREHEIADEPTPALRMDDTAKRRLRAAIRNRGPS